MVNSSSTNNDISILHEVIAAFRVWQNIIRKCCGIIGHKADSYIINGTKFLPPSPRNKINQSNELRVNETTEPLRYWKSQPPEVHFKYCIPPPNTSPLVSDITGRLNHHAVDNGDLDIYPTDYALKYGYDSVPEPYNTPIKSIDDDEMEQILQLSHLEHDDDLLDLDQYMIQA